MNFGPASSFGLKGDAALSPLRSSCVTSARTSGWLSESHVQRRQPSCASCSAVTLPYF